MRLLLNLFSGDGWSGVKESPSLSRSFGKLMGQNVKRILFVCTGNICRSPMAEAFTRARIPESLKSDLKISSAGTFAWIGQPASSLAVGVLEEVGIDLAAHRSRELSKKMIDKADLIVAMAGEHKDAVIGTSPDSESRVIVMGELDNRRGNPDIMDPLGGDRGTYARTRDEISGLIRLLIDYLIDKFELKK